MRVCVLLVCVTACLWSVVQAEPITVSATTILLGGLVFLKLSVLAGLSAPKFPFGIGKRSVHDETVGVDSNLLLTSVAHMDPDGCILKLLCHLQTKEGHLLTPEEASLASMFNGTEPLTSSNTGFVYAAEVGRQTHDQAVCNKLFSKCTLQDSQLHRVLQKAWGCGLDDLE